MKNYFFGLAAVACLGLTAPSFAANGSAAAAMVRDAYLANKRIEARAEKLACDSAKAGGSSDCKPGTRLKGKVKAT